MFVLMDNASAHHTKEEGKKSESKMLEIRNSEEINSPLYNNITEQNIHLRGDPSAASRGNILAEAYVTPVSCPSKDPLSNTWITSVTRKDEEYMKRSVPADPIQERLVGSILPCPVPQQRAGEHGQIPSVSQVPNIRRHGHGEVYMVMDSSTARDPFIPVTSDFMNPTGLGIQRAGYEFRTLESEHVPNERLVELQPFQERQVSGDGTDVLGMTCRTQDMRHYEVDDGTRGNYIGRELSHEGFFKVGHFMENRSDFARGVHEADRSEKLMTSVGSESLTDWTAADSINADIAQRAAEWEKYNRMTGYVVDRQSSENVSDRLHMEWSQVRSNENVSSEDPTYKFNETNNRQDIGHEGSKGGESQIPVDNGVVKLTNSVNRNPPSHSVGIEEGAALLDTNSGLIVRKEEPNAVELDAQNTGPSSDGDELINNVGADVTFEESKELDLENYETKTNIICKSHKKAKGNVFVVETRSNMLPVNGPLVKGQRMMPGTWRKSKRKKKNFFYEKRKQNRRKECMVPGCFLRACSNRFVEFPEDLERRKEWAVKTKLNEKFPDVDPLVPLPIRVGLCMGHFQEDDFNVIPRGEGKVCSLKDGVDPSIFPWVENAVSMKSGMDIFKGNKASREAKLLTRMKSELDNMLNPPSQSEFIIHSYQPRRKNIVPPLKISLRACVASAKKKKKKAAKAKKKHNRERKREKGYDVISNEDPLYDVKVENFENFEEDVIEREPSMEGHSLSSSTDQGAQAFSGLNHFLAPYFNGTSVNEHPSPDLLGSVNVHLIATCVQAAISPMMARLEAFQETVESRMEQLEGRVSTRLGVLEEKVSICLEKLGQVVPNTRQRRNLDAETIGADAPQEDPNPAGMLEISDFNACEGETATHPTLTEDPIQPPEDENAAEADASPIASGSGFTDSSIHQMEMDLKPFAISEREYEMMEGEDLEVQMNNVP
ncbi:uncharacterized protein LOC119594666 [Penaeus monodon]|uniref:uncharacterized protein LOC119594666 n=1 Tax=Penaeus monodon TaxID=6687 RepID=UPI0018A70EDB|nr:uncharacterized protein LOC119594666 [Penaeus monodon]